MSLSMKETTVISSYINGKFWHSVVYNWTIKETKYKLTRKRLNCPILMRWAIAIYYSSLKTEKGSSQGKKTKQLSIN